jgi:3-hydroxybutyryl-CoA dehydrogenase
MMGAMTARFDVETMGIVGAGPMGLGIAHVAARSGVNVVLSDIDASVLAVAMETIEDRLAQDGASPAAADRIRTTTVVDDHRNCSLVLETAKEDEAIKSEIFRRLDAVCPETTVLVSNTSSIPIARLGAVTRRPPRVAGMHFMVPVAAMPLVEVIRSLDTSDETRDRVFSLARQLGKTPVECRDFPGFVSNRLVMVMINEAVFAVHEGVASVEAVDEIMQLGMNHPMGPLRLADLIGLDTCLTVLSVMHRGMGDPKYRPCPLLVRMVESGRIGRRSGKGFYEYAGE